MPVVHALPSVPTVQFESRDGHLRAQMHSDEQGREELFVYDHRGNLLDVLTKVEGLAPAAPTLVSKVHGPST